MAYPSYDELKRPDETWLPLAWGVWGADDQVGCPNNITPEIVIASAYLVTTGRCFPFDLPIHEPFGHLASGAHRLPSAPQQAIR